jgi:DNA-directed RNA polymerase subunit beta'
MISDLQALKLKVASPEMILEWSHGEVIKPETINYRTQKPEMDGLFCERTFGPVKDWECYCGKYKRIRYKGIVCDKCGVEVTRSVVRRERMGHITLAVPVSHIWFLRGVPSKLGLLLDLSVQNLEKVVYFASYIVTRVDELAKEEARTRVDGEFKARKKEISREYQDIFNQLNLQKEEELAATEKASGKKSIEAKFETQILKREEQKKEDLAELAKAVDSAKKELKELAPLKIISEMEYRDLSLKYGQVFEARIGAEAIYEVLQSMDTDKRIEELTTEAKKTTTAKRKKLLRRLKLLKDLKSAGVRPHWMMIKELPVIPPDLRPMVQLDGGRFASSDLNDLYRRVINRNNRLKKLLELNAPEVICRNEKRMLQEAVDALIDNSARRGKAVAASTGQKRTLKSLSDMLKGKQGRFRQNLLGKRVDYSGRSVIVVGPKLKLDECGIPKTMALELFKPFVIGQLIKREFAHNVRSASKLIETGTVEVWDILEEVISDSYVFLNRAPTLHRLGIQAFRPLLIEGKAIQIHPMVCQAFNADFDGDQMAVHVPLTFMARKEAKEIMLSAKNLLKPADGEPVATADKDMVLGCYYMTNMQETDKEEKHLKAFATSHEAQLAYNSGVISINEPIRMDINGTLTKTCIGRVIFNEILPPELQFVNETLDKKGLKRIAGNALELFGEEKTAGILDNIKEIGFRYATKSGITWSMADLAVPDDKESLLTEGDEETNQIYKQYKMGLLTDDERYNRVIEVWAKIRDRVAERVEHTIAKDSPVRYMIESGARGSWGQITQMAGMRGLMINPSGNTIELPVKGNFKEGLDVLEYFISTHGARKGLSDTAIKTASAGYLTRRLVDVSQDVVIEEPACKDTQGMLVTAEESETMGQVFHERITGRVVAEDVDGIAKTGDLITKAIAQKFEEANISEVRIFTVLTCQTKRGICQKCYGYDLGYNKMVKIGQAVGIVAAQAIGEPGTQLTMRTFHTGGVASAGDITQGLPRVAELFEARQIKKPALIADIDGKLSIDRSDEKNPVIRITSATVLQDGYEISDIYEVKVKDKAKVKEGQALFINTKTGNRTKSPADGIVRVEKDKLVVTRQGKTVSEHPLPIDMTLWVEDGELVSKGQQLTEGHVDVHELFRLKGKEAVQKYIIKDVQQIYSSQGQKVSDKHLEIIVRQMMRVLRVTDPGDTEMIPDEFVTHVRFNEENDRVRRVNGNLAKGDQVLLGITKASLSTDSFLSAASFQETVKVLIDAAISGRQDPLIGIKENVIIGKLIPAGTGFALGQKKQAAALVRADKAAENNHVIHIKARSQKTKLPRYRGQLYVWCWLLIATGEDQDVGMIAVIPTLRIQSVADYEVIVDFEANEVKLRFDARCAP